MTSVEGGDAVALWISIIAQARAMALQETPRRELAEWVGALMGECSRQGAPAEIIIACCTLMARLEAWEAAGQQTKRGAR